jgi:hypothetical protein
MVRERYRIGHRDVLGLRLPENQGVWAPIISDTTETSMVFTGTLANAYRFHSVARDLRSATSSSRPTRRTWEVTLSACCSRTSTVTTGNAYRCEM